MTLNIHSSLSLVNFRFQGYECEVLWSNGQITCLPLQTPCQNRNEYLFWDAYHPIEAGSAIVAKRAYSAQVASNAYPVDIRRLAQI